MSEIAETAMESAIISPEEIKKEEEKDLVPEFYSQHGGDPRLLDISFCVLLGRLPTDYLADTFEQFKDCIKNMIREELKLDPATVKQVVRIPKLEQNCPNQSNALRVLLCFEEKAHKYRMMGRQKDIELSGMTVESLEELPAELLEISDEDARALADMSTADEIGEEEIEEVEEDEHDEELDTIVDADNSKDAKAEGEEEKKESADEKKDESAPKKKVYEDEDEKASFELNWEGAPEFQWRLCVGARDEKKLIIENLLWADLNNVFIYRTTQRATSCEINFPMRFTSDGTKSNFGKLTLYFPGFVAIMDEALKHLIYFRSGDGRRIKVFLPQTAGSLKRKEEFEGKLGRLIKPTPRMMELVIKTLPENYQPTLDDACSWFPYQAVIGCELVNDEMGKPCAIVKFETAEEAVAAHAGKSFVAISVIKPDAEGKNEETVTTNCNVFMKGVEAHFGSLLTFYDQRKKIQDQRANRKKTGAPPVKRPAGSTIRGPAQKKRAPSPAKRIPNKDVPSRGGPSRRGVTRNVNRGGSSARRSSPPRSTRGGRQNSGASRSMPRPSYRNDSYSNSSRAQPRAEPFTGYGYAHFENRFNDRPSVDPFGRPVYAGNSAFGNSFNRDDSNRNYSSFSDRRRY